MKGSVLKDMNLPFCTRVGFGFPFNGRGVPKEQV